MRSIIYVILILSIVTMGGCDSKNEGQYYAKKIDSMEALMENTYFIVTYDTLAASKEFVVAGGGVWSEDGWFKNRELYVAIQKIDGEYLIKNLSSGP